jgi:hypothetical protein
MDIRVNEVHSQVQAVDSNTFLSPQVMRQIIKACIRAVKEDRAREKMLAGERRLKAGVSADE